MISAGPGPGPLLASAGAWTTLSAEYASAAAELTSLLGTVQAGSWEGPSAAMYAAAHVPYLAWLEQASVDAAGVAVQQETAAAAYASALATMPTLAELAANHTIHGVLIGTNFFGVNTIPIALNEADYVRMWVQAATTMTTYQAITGTALATAPRSMPAPVVLTPGVGAAGMMSANLMQTAAQVPATESGRALSTPDWWSENPIVQALANYFGDPNSGLVGGQEVARLLLDPVGTIQQLLTDLFTNPSGFLTTWGPFLLGVGYQLFFQPVGWGTWGAVLSAPLWGPALLAGAGLGALGFLALVPQPPPVDVPGEPVPVLSGERVNPWPVAGIAPAVPASGVAPAPAPTPGTAAPAGAPAPAPAAAQAVMYAVGGDFPDGGVGPTLNEGAGVKAPAADIAAAASVASLASAREKRKARRQRGAEAKDRGYRDEYMTLDGPSDEDPVVPPSEPEPVRTQSSERGAGTFGFSGTAPKQRLADAAGLTTLSDDAFGSGPSEPMLPGTWGEEDAPERPEPE